MNPAVWGNVAQWAGAVATSLAVFVALLKEEFLRCIRRPELALQIRREDSNLSPVIVGDAGHPAAWKGEAYFLRMWVENTGNQRAEKVQVFLSKALREQDDHSFRPVHGFLPMNLRWSHSDFFRPEVYADGISPGMGKHCDLGSISEIKNPTLVPVEGLGPDQVSLDLWLEVFPATQSHRLIPGTYKLEIKIATSNCKPVTHEIIVTFTGQWFMDEAKMFSEGVRLRPA